MTKNAACYWSLDQRVCRWNSFVAIQLLFWVASRASTTEAFGVFWKTAVAGGSLSQQQQQQQPRTVSRTKPERMHHLQAAQGAAGTQPDSQPPPKYPRAAVAVAVRCLCSDSDSNSDANQPEARYLLIRRGNEPNKGGWAIPGGKLEWGETTLEGAKRELAEEVVFVDADNIFSSSSSSDDDTTNHWELAWSPHPYTATDAIFGDQFHYLIAVCFAECRRRLTVGGSEEDGTQQLRMPPPPPSLAAADDATDARWWSLRELAAATDNGNDPELANSLPEGSLTPGLVERLRWTERLYQAGVLLPVQGKPGGSTKRAKPRANGTG